MDVDHSKHQFGLGEACAQCEAELEELVAEIHRTGSILSSVKRAVEEHAGDVDATTDRIMAAVAEQDGQSDDTINRLKGERDAARAQLQAVRDAADG